MHDLEAADSFPDLVRSEWSVGEALSEIFVVRRDVGTGNEVLFRSEKASIRLVVVLDRLQFELRFFFVSADAEVVVFDFPG